jgi:hypothetical protein
LASLFVILWTLLPQTVLGQQTAPADDSDKKTIQMLLDRIDRLEARVKQLEDGKTQVSQETKTTPKSPIAGATAATSQPVAANPSVAASSAPPPPPQEDQMAPSERMDLSETLLRIRGFGDVTFHGATDHGSTTSFSLGQLDLFVTSDLSENFNFLSEIVFEAENKQQFGVSTGEPPNSFGVDIERLLLQYSHNQHLNIALGRYHTAIGYYNTAYHHSTWLQTTTGRPFLFAFEDQGGILPVHNVGVSVSGLISSPSVGLHYVAEVGNGRRSRATLGAEDVQNVVDENNHKSVNLALFFRPESIRGLQAGFSVYRDLLTPLGKPAVGETILAAHAVWILPKFEWLNEAVLVRHHLEGTGLTYNTPAFYSQVSRQYGDYRPYFRYEYMNAPNNEPIFPEVGLRTGPSVGVRYDANESVALKLQYDFTAFRQQPSSNALALQVGFTF